MINPEFFLDPNENKESPPSQAPLLTDVHSFSVLSIPSQKLNNEQEDFFAWKKEADKGLAEAQFQTGLCYEKGKGIALSYSSAFHYYKLAADQGEGNAQFSLAMLYKNGKGIQQSYSQAIYYYKLAAKKGVSSAYIQMGKLYAEGKGVQQSFKKAIKYYERAAQQRHSLGWIYIARAYEKGEGVQKSLEAAFHYYQLSADQNLSGGLAGLANCFAQGKGTLKSIEKAIYYYQLAAEQGGILDQINFARYLLRINQDEKLAIHYLTQVIQSEECDLKLRASCQGLLAFCYEKGKGVKKSEQNALYYYKRAAEGGNEKSQFWLGDAYLSGGLGVEKSAEQAIYFYKLAANQGHSVSLRKLGQCYERGEGIEQSSEKAFYYYKLAAEIEMKHRCGYSVLALARCYKLGIGIPKSLEIAIYYYKLAAENGFPMGYYEVACCYQAIEREENKRKVTVYFKMAGDIIKIKSKNELKIYKKRNIFNYIKKQNFILYQIIVKKQSLKKNSNSMTFKKQIRF